MWPAEMPLSINLAVTNGMRTSSTTSSIMKTGVSNDAVLYCLTCLKSVFSIIQRLNFDVFVLQNYKTSVIYEANVKENKQNELIQLRLIDDSFNLN